jgi:hypothetical protein
MSPILGIWASQISGRLWEPQGAYDALSTVTVPSGGVASITFAAIPTGYKHLQIRSITRFDTSGEIDFRFNSDSGSNYSYHRIYGQGTSAVAEGAANTAYATVGYNSTAANTFSGAVIDILDYASVNKFKTVRSLNGTDTNGGGLILLDSTCWRSTDAINSITVFSKDSRNFQQYSQYTLYGIR